MPAIAKNPEGTRMQLLTRAAASFRRPFTKEQLIIRSWELFPASFGLKGWEERYPDSNKVVSYLYHKKRGLIALGVIDFCRDDRFVFRNPLPENLHVEGKTAS
jgi:hypothetical protein